jgi:hypothetical protein
MSSNRGRLGDESLMMARSRLLSVLSFHVKRVPLACPVGIFELMGRDLGWVVVKNVGVWICAVEVGCE